MLFDKDGRRFVTVAVVAMYIIDITFHCAKHKFSFIENLLTSSCHGYKDT